MLDEFITVARADEVGEQILLRVEVEGQPVVLTRVDGRLCALSGICTHEHIELFQGDVEDETIWCPIHASGFNVFTGAVTSPPADVPLAVYSVREVDGAVQVSRQPQA